MGFSKQEYWSGVPLPSPVSKNPSSILGPHGLVHQGMSQSCLEWTQSSRNETKSLRMSWQTSWGYGGKIPQSLGVVVDNCTRKGSVIDRPDVNSLGFFCIVLWALSQLLSCWSFYFVINLFWLHWVLVASRGIFRLHYGFQDLLFFKLQHVGSSSLTRDWAWAPFTGSTES